MSSCTAAGSGRPTSRRRRPPAADRSAHPELLVPALLGLLPHLDLPGPVQPRDEHAFVVEEREGLARGARREREPGEHTEAQVLMATGERPAVAPEPPER